MRPARAFHDLNNVTALVITGWRGSHEVKPHVAGDRGVAIIAPRRHEDEFWTFQRVTSDGELHCFSSLIGDPSLLTDPGEPLVILMPASRIDGISVSVPGAGDESEG
jgi:hypothetical protein